MNKNNKKIILLFPHRGSDNRGCEAIIRGTVSIINEEFKDFRIILLSNNPDSDKISKINKYVSIVNSSIVKKYTLRWLLRGIISKVLNIPIYAQYISNYKDFLLARNVDIGFSIGGDNYCYGKPFYLYAMNKILKKRNKSLILWGCSVEPSSILDDKEMCKDLSLFDLIISRESITYNAIIKAGINNNVYLHADPAFTMKSEEISLPIGWEKDNIIGINLSPLILKYHRKNFNLMNLFISLVKYILDSTPYSIAFIPHVTIPNNNDWDTLKVLYDSFKKKERLILIGQEYNSPQIKYLISKCKLFIGARTHATIAAYSSYVPTLAIGYSVKAKGIARDIFGSEEGLILPVQEIENKQQLFKAFDSLCEREDELREHLLSFIPGYVQTAWDAGKHLKKIF